MTTPWNSSAGGVAPGFFGVDDLIDTVLDWHCPRADVRRDLVRLLYMAVCDGIELSDRLARGPCLFLTNHQTALDILLFSYVVAALRREPVNLIGWHGALFMHTGSLLTQIATRPEPGAYDLRAHVRPHYVDQRYPSRVLAVAAQLQRDLGAAAEPVSAVIATEGRRQATDGQPVSHVGSSFVDLAHAANVPIHPVRFVWGLPERSARRRFSWPVRLAPQRYIVGAPIMPADLAALNVRDRGALVARAIDGLWRSAPPSHAARNADRHQRVDRIVASTGMAQTKALLCDLLLSADPDKLSSEGRMIRPWLRDAAAAFRYKEDDWLFAFALWLSDGLNINYIPFGDLYPDFPAAGP